MEQTQKSNRGGSRTGAGRKTLYEGGRRQLAISCSAAQKEKIALAAKEAGITVAQYVLQKCGV